MIYQKKLWEESTRDALEAVKKAGVEIFYPDKEPFREAVEGMHQSYQGTPLYDLIREINETK